jgi:hypothetical protein
MTKRITLRVDVDTYRRWKAAAKQDDRTLSVWLIRRGDGKEATAPEEAAIVTSEVAELPAKETVVTKRTTLLTSEVAELPAKEPVVTKKTTLLTRLAQKPEGS